MSSVRQTVLFPPVRLGQLLILLLILLTQTVRGNPLIEMELKAGLGGQAVAGQATEIQIRLFAANPVEASLEVMDGNGLTRLPLYLHEQRETTLWLPAIPQPVRPVKVRLVTDQASVIERTVAFEQNHSPLTIIASTVPIAETLNRHQRPMGIVPVVLSARGLPHTPQAYAGIDAIVVDAESLSRLSQDQYLALGDYLSRCGIMLLSAADQTDLQRLRNTSGCGGRFIHTYDALSQVTSKLDELKTQRPPKPPTPQDLLSLGQPLFQQRMVTPLYLYLGGYILLIALAGWRVQNTHYVLLLPLLVAGAGGLAWSGSGSPQLIAWAESESGDQSMQVSSLLLLGGDRRGENRVTLAADAHLSNFRGESQAPSMLYAQAGADLVLHGHTHLLSPQVYHLTSIARRSPPFRLSLRHGHPEVVLSGESPPAETRLLWRGQAYRLPVLAQDEHWQPHENQGRRLDSREERLLNRHLAFGDPALLLPLTPAPAQPGDPGMHTTAWLVIRHTPRQRL